MSDIQGYISNFVSCKVTMEHIRLVLHYYFTNACASYISDWGIIRGLPSSYVVSLEDIDFTDVPDVP